MLTNIINSTQEFYSKKIDPSLGLQTGDGEVTLISPLIYEDNSHLYIEPKEATIPTFLPNICSAYNNNLIKITLMIGETRPSFLITIPQGVYSTSNLNDAINDVPALYAYYTSKTDSPIILSENKVTQRNVWRIDLTKFNYLNEVSGVMIDMTVSGIYQVLGWNSGDILTITSNSVVSAPNEYQYDTFGNRVYVKVKGLGDLSDVNGTKDSTLISINLGYGSMGNTFSWPNAGQTSTPLRLNCSSKISKFSVQFVGENGKSIVAGSGTFFVQFVIIEQQGENGLLE